MKKLCLIVALGKDLRTIGDDNNDLPWKLKDDKEFFKNTTLGHVVIQGRKTYESIPEKWRPLPDRTTIVLTKDPTWRTKTVKEDRVIIVHSPWEALEKAEKNLGEKIFIIGGGEIYKMALEKIVFDEIHLTTVSGFFNGPVTLPHFRFSLQTEYRLNFEKKFEAIPGRNSHDFSIQSYIRR